MNSVNFKVCVTENQIKPIKSTWNTKNNFVNLYKKNFNLNLQFNKTPNFRKVSERDNNNY